MEEEVKTSVEPETGSEESIGEVTQPEQESKTDYQVMYEKAEKERRELATLLGRQSNELGQLRAAIEGQKKEEQSPELNPTDYFDAETAKAIEKVAEQKAKALLESYQAQQEQARLRNDFQGVYNEYDVTEENLSDLAYYASAKNVTIRQAAESLASKGIIDKRKVAGKSTEGGSKLTKAPMGAPKVAMSSGEVGKDLLKMSTDQFNKLSDEEIERLGQKYYSPQ